MIPLYIMSLENPLVLLVILLIILVLFGAKRIPEVMHGLGKGLSEFKKGTREATDQFHQALNVEEPPAATPPPPPAAAPPAAPPSDSDKPA